VVREGVEQGGEMTEALYAYMNNKTIKKIKNK
jgi:NaMN:DMB phosphoribosyltransferase